MSSGDYVGIHGRSPWDQVDPRHEHMVPEFWEDLDVGICPLCGRTVGWDAGNEKWRVRRNLNVIVLSDREVELLLKHLQQDTNADEFAKVIEIENTISAMRDLNKPFPDD